MTFYQKCIPGAYFLSIEDIPYETLKEQGYKTLFFDLDNTIIGYDEEKLSDKNVLLFQRLAKDFSIVIISNSHFNRVSKAINKQEIPFVWSAKKPLKFGFKKALKKVDGDPKTTVLVGDQLLTDVLGGQRMGFHTVLVRSVKRSSDRKITQFNRKIEKKVLAKIKEKFPKLYQERLEQYVKDHDM